MLPKIVDAVSHAPRYVRLAFIACVLSTLVANLLPPLLHLVDPSYSSFSLDTLNVVLWGALLLAATVHLGAWAYERLLPRFKTYQQDSLEVDGKFFENLTDDLETGLAELHPQLSDAGRLGLAIENRHVKQFKFLIRCVRTAFCLLSFYALVVLTKDFVLALLTVVPR